MKFTIACLATLPFVAFAAALPPAQQELFDTERAFVRLAAEKGFRDSFYAYFADAGVAFNPHPFRVRIALANQPPASAAALSASRCRAARRSRSGRIAPRAASPRASPCGGCGCG